MVSSKHLSLSLAFISLTSFSFGQSHTIAEWSFNQASDFLTPWLDNTYGQTLSNQTTTNTNGPAVSGGFAMLAGFGAMGVTIGSPGDTAPKPEIGGVINNNAVGVSGSRSALDSAGDPDESGAKGLTVMASTKNYFGGLTISFHASHGGTDSRYFQLMVSSDGVNFEPVTGGTGSFSGDSLGTNGQLSTSVTFSDDGLIEWITNSDVVVGTSTSNGDAYVYEFSYSLPAGSVYENNENFAFKIARVHAPEVGDYVSSGAGTVFGEENGYARASTYFDMIRISAATEIWGGYGVYPEGDVNTGAWLGWINVASNPWVYVYDMEKWIYMPEESVSSSGAWAYLFK